MWQFEDLAPLKEIKWNESINCFIKTVFQVIKDIFHAIRKSGTRLVTMEVVRSKPYIFSKKMFQLARYCLRAFEMII
jgi:hypothetical protein